MSAKKKKCRTSFELLPYLVKDFQSIGEPKYDFSPKNFRPRKRKRAQSYTKASVSHSCVEHSTFGSTFEQVSQL